MSWLAPAPSIGDQHVGAPRCGDLGERGVEHRDVIAGGERPGVARAPHHREAVADVGGPGGQRVEPEALRSERVHCYQVPYRRRRPQSRDEVLVTRHIGLMLGSSGALEVGDDGG